MTFCDGPVGALVAHVATVGTGRPAVAAARRWRLADPALPFGSPAELAALGRGLVAGEADVLVGRLIAVGGEWAELTALAVLAPRLAWMARRSWSTPQGQVEAEAELVARVWEAIHAWSGPPPATPRWEVCGPAWWAARAVGRTERRRQSRTISLPGHTIPGSPQLQAKGSGECVEAVIAGELVDAVQTGRVKPRAAAAFWSTRVAGMPTAQAAAILGMTPDGIRQARRRVASAVFDSTVSGAVA